MRNLTHLLIGVLLAIFLLVFTTKTLMAQDPVKVAPKNTKVLLENDRVRVLEYQSKPGQGVCGIGMHSHRAHLTYVLSSYKVKATSSDGKTKEIERKAGEVFWREAETHSAENIGATEGHILIIELKEPEKKQK